MKNKILVYDDNCPLCTWYSGLFVKYGFLKAEGRKPFSTLDEQTLLQIEFNKSRNEIPLLDTSTKKVSYGIDALLEILEQKIPWINSVGNIKPLKWFLRKFYKVISYNRKVIVAKKCGPGSIDCSPDIDYKYRFAFMAFCLLFNTLLLYPVHYNLFTKLPYYHLSLEQLQSVHFGFVIINCTSAFVFPKAKAFEYLGQINMLALVAILLFIPILFIDSFLSSEWIITIYMVAIAAFIFKEYIRRMEYAGVLTNNKWIISLNLLSLCGFILFLFN